MQHVYLQDNIGGRVSGFNPSKTDLRGDYMRTVKRIAILPALAFFAACGADEPRGTDLSFLDDLELAVSAPDSATLSPDELKLQLAEAEEKAALAATPAAPATSAPSRTSAPRQSSVYSSPAPARVPQARVETVKHTKRDAAIGAGAGAVIGAAVAGRGERVQGAAIGAVVGGVLGGVIGNNVDKSTRVVYE